MKLADACSCLNPPPPSLLDSKCAFKTSEDLTRVAKIGRVCFPECTGGEDFKQYAILTGRLNARRSDTLSRSMPV